MFHQRLRRFLAFGTAAHQIIGAVAGQEGGPEKGNMEPWKTHRMPKIIAERLAWRNLRNAKAPDGGSATRKTAPCPTGGSGCSATTIVAEGNSVSIIFDYAQRAIAVTQDSTLVTFGYDGYDVRRPPGW